MVAKVVVEVVVDDADELNDVETVLEEYGDEVSVYAIVVVDCCAFSVVAADSISWVVVLCVVLLTVDALEVVDSVKVVSLS